MTNKGSFGGICATQTCAQVARWQSVVEVRVKGSDTPYRCPTCCDAIAEATTTTGETSEDHKPMA